MTRTRTRLQQVESDRAAGVGDVLGILLEDRLVGRITIFNIAREPFQSASVGYWVTQDMNGRGVATAALALLVDEAFGRLGLHRLEAATLTTNSASQLVLRRNDFRRIGLAPR